MRAGESLPQNSVTVTVTVTAHGPRSTGPTGSGTTTNTRVIKHLRPVF